MLVLALMMPPKEYLATEVKRAIKVSLNKESLISNIYTRKLLN